MKRLHKTLVFTAAVLALSGGLAYGNGGPLGLCPDRSPSMAPISEVAAAEDFQISKWAIPLTAVDRNQDGFACIVLRCTPCPPGPYPCHTFCMFSGPIADNNVIPE